MAEDHIDRTQVFLDSLQQLGDQLKAAEERQVLPHPHDGPAKAGPH